MTKPTSKTASFPEETEEATSSSNESKIPITLFLIMASLLRGKTAEDGDTVAATKDQWDAIRRLADRLIDPETVENVQAVAVPKDQWEAIRGLADALIDPKTAEVTWRYIYSRQHENDETGYAVREYLVRKPGTKEWFSFANLSSGTRAALSEREQLRLRH